MSGSCTATPSASHTTSSLHSHDRHAAHVLGLLGDARHGLDRLAVGVGRVAAVRHQAPELALRLRDRRVERKELARAFRAACADPRAKLVADHAALLLATLVADHLREGHERVLAGRLARRRPVVDADRSWGGRSGEEKTRPERVLRWASPSDGPAPGEVRERRRALYFWLVSMYSASSCRSILKLVLW